MPEEEIDEFFEKYDGKSYPEGDSERHTPNWDLFIRDLEPFLRRQLPVGCKLRELVLRNDFTITGRIYYHDEIILFFYEVPKVTVCNIDVFDSCGYPIYHRNRDSDVDDWNKSSLAGFKEDFKHCYIKIYDGT